MAVKSTKTTTRKTTKPKTTTTKAAPAKAAPVVATDTPNDGEQPTVLKKSDFLDRVMERTDVKKRDAKPAIEAALAVLAEALSAGEDVALPPMGRFKVVKAKPIDSGGEILTLKLRIKPETTGKPAKAKPDLDDDDDDDD